ncbi:arabinogalactan protein 13-like [Euphorbia lathyris]|uniref:arabinogalactan protein 13-like n=1 Tax=Euphorbia lathyris TaxID=212925 RepID=UPI0033134FF6
MEAMEMNLLAVLIVMIMSFSAIQSASAVEAPATSPTSDVTAFIPAFIASIVALAFGFFF